MAQVLKDSVRDTILKNAGEEFLEQGYEKASMRSIAQKSKMTVGNLYRYFKSKDELSDTIVSPTYLLLNSMIDKITGGKLNMHTDGSGLPEDPEELRGMLRSVSEGLVDIYTDHRTEVNILMMGTTVNKRLTAWFSAVLARMISKSIGCPISDSRIELLSISYAESICGGIRTMLRNSQESSESLKKLVLIYLNSYLNMLSQEIPALD